MQLQSYNKLDMPEGSPYRLTLDQIAKAMVGKVSEPAPSHIGIEAFEQTRLRPSFERTGDVLGNLLRPVAEAASNAMQQVRRTAQSI